MSKPAAVRTEAVHHSHFPTHHVHHSDPQSAARALADVEEAQRQEQRKVNARRGHLYVAGRVLLAALFLTSAIAKVVHFEATREAMSNFGMSAATLLLSFAIALELAGGLMLALGYKARIAAIGLIVYLALVTVSLHTDFSVDLNRAFALANLAFAGGLLMVVGHGAGNFSLDKRLERLSAARYRG